MSVSTGNPIFATFAAAIYAKAKLMREHGLDEVATARVRESISDDLKKLSNFVRPAVSVEAKAAADKLHVAPVNLFTKTWHDQPTFDKKRRLFHLEHVCPVSNLRDECCKAGTPDEVLGIITAKLRVAWILKEEDARLTRLGYRVTRPDPEAAYEAAKIKLLHPTDVEVK